MWLWLLGVVMRAGLRRSRLIVSLDSCSLGFLFRYFEEAEHRTHRVAYPLLNQQLFDRAIAEGCHPHRSLVCFNLDYFLIGNHLIANRDI